MWGLIGVLALVGCKGPGENIGTDYRETGQAPGKEKAESGQPEAGDISREGKMKVAVTLFPYYDFVRQIAGNQVDLTLVVPAGMDSHSFEPTPADMRTIQNADILICNGGVMEHWLSQVLDAVDTSHMVVMTMMDYVDVVEEKFTEGMEDGEHPDHPHRETEQSGPGQRESGGSQPEKSLYVDDDGHHEEIEYDEHIWTSPVNAIRLAGAIGQVLEEQDPAHGPEYRDRTRAFTEKLDKIDQGFRRVCENPKRRLIVVGDKFPFRYLAEEYSLDYRAAFSGCSTDTEPSARTIAYLIDKVNTEQIPVVYFLETGSRRVAEIIGEETGARPLLLHSCHTVTRRQFEEGITYEELMEQNIENLRKGLNE